MRSDHDPHQSGSGALVLVAYALLLLFTLIASSVETTTGGFLFALLVIAGLGTALLIPWAARR